jgi:hypothetical protein
LIIVDDRLSLDALAGRFEDDLPVATTWGFHFRLSRALAGDSGSGALSRMATAEVRQAVAAPPAARLIVLDPRAVTTGAAALAARHQLNLLAAELVASAVYHNATVRLSSANVGRGWPEVMVAEGVSLEIV